MRGIHRGERGRNRADLAFTGWFGPIGVAALFYGLLARRHTGDDRYWVVAILLVTASVAAHGMTAGLFTLLYGRVAPAASQAEGDSSTEQG
jgi:NhaP-type Na+/H+ or K+/H+ antiporter